MITRNKLKIIILASFCVLGILTSIPGIMLGVQKTNISSVKSALLNMKYVNQVNEITFSFPDGCSFIFNKTTNRLKTEVWMGQKEDGTVFTANTTLLEQLIARASQTRSMAEVSDSYTAWSALGLSDDNAVNVTFSSNAADGSSTTFSSLFFGYGNADATMIYVRNDRKSSSWRIQDDFSSYLTDSISFWADQRLLPIGSSDETDPSRSSISTLTQDGNRTLVNDVSSRTVFDEKVHTLLSLRSSGLLSLTDFEMHAPQAIPVMQITLSDTSSADNSGAYGCIVYQAVFEDGVEYFARNFGILSADLAPYLLQISEWTFSKISETLSF